MATANLTATLLREDFHYDPDTGVFTRLRSSGGIKAGAISGSVNSDGYLDIRVLGKLYRAHRLAWLYMTGEWPAGVIDHKDHEKTNNKYVNLRDVTHAVNLQNQNRARSDSYLGVLGVIRSGQKYRAEISLGGRTRHIGSYETVEQASAAYWAAKATVHAPVN